MSNNYTSILDTSFSQHNIIAEILKDGIVKDKIIAESIPKVTFYSNHTFIEKAVSNKLAAH